VLGIIFGSFANVVIWRFPRGESVSHPPSACPRCQTPIRWYDNVPVASWILLRGRCRSCSEPISARYPAVELLSGALWLAAGLRFGLSAQTLWAIVLFYMLLLLAFIDWDTMRLPNPLVGTLFLVGVAGALFSQISGVPAVPLVPAGEGLWASPLATAIIGAVASAGTALAIAGVYGLARRRQGFGMGDVKLLGAIGVYLGLYGLLVLFLGSVIGAAYGIISATATGRSLALKFPFGPFLALAAVIVTLFGPGMWEWYAGFLS